VIFDWDDTLLPSYDLQHLGLHQKSKTTMHRSKSLTDRKLEAICRALQRLESKVHELLLTALHHADCVVIVTNAEKGWVELSSSTFMPSIHRLLSRCKVVSARSTFEREYPSATVEWKRRSIKMVLDELLNTEIDIRSVSQFKEDSKGMDRESKMGTTKMEMEKVDVLQVISIGDSLVERQAVFDVTKCIDPERNGVGRVRTKSVKLTGTPTIDWLFDELQTVLRSFLLILRHPFDLDYQVFLRERDEDENQENE